MPTQTQQMRKDFIVCLSDRIMKQIDDHMTRYQAGGFNFDEALVDVVYVLTDVSISLLQVEVDNNRTDAKAAYAKVMALTHRSRPDAKTLESINSLIKSVKKTTQAKK
jgi:hypothetical protein